MARQAEGWKLVLPRGRTTYCVRFRWQGVRHFLGTGRADLSEASAEAARLYAETVSGRKVEQQVSGDLDRTVAEFVAHYAATHTGGTADTVEMYFAAHFTPFFRSVERFTAPMYADYIALRIGEVTRVTLRKELSALRQFREWLGTRGVHVAEVPRLAKQGHPGVRHKNARKQKATIIRPAEAKRILLAMPLRSRRTGAWVRPLFTVLWETGLRPITVLRLEAGIHYTRGARKLFVSREIDKEQFERHVPLTDAARRALDRAFPKSGEGRLFHAAEESLRFSLAAAVAQAGLTARKIGVYDFKHSRISHDANGGLPLAGIAHLVGHTNISTTARYVTTGEDAARAVLKGRR
jgi:site-specific recombinase XerD